MTHPPTFQGQRWQQRCNNYPTIEPHKRLSTWVAVYLSASKLKCSTFECYHNTQLSVSLSTWVPQSTNTIHTRMIDEMRLNLAYEQERGSRIQSLNLNPIPNRVTSKLRVCTTSFLTFTCPRLAWLASCFSLHSPSIYPAIYRSAILYIEY